MAAEGNRLGERLVAPREHFVGEPEGHPAGDRSWRASVDPDAASALLEGGGLRHADDSVLRGDIGDDSGAADHAQRARHVDHRSAVAHPRSRIRGSTYFNPRNTPRMLTAMTRSKSSSGNSTIGRTRVWMPALLTKPSTCPQSSKARMA